jgi:hypothetical protein
MFGVLHGCSSSYSGCFGCYMAVAVHIRDDTAVGLSFASASTRRSVRVCLPACRLAVEEHPTIMFSFAVT